MEIIPVIHIVDNKQVFTNVETCVKCGINKIFLIDHSGSERSLPSYSEEIKADYKLWVGINLLGHDIKKILTRAEEWALFNFHTDAIWSDEDLSHLSVDELLDIKSKITYKGEYFGGLAFKYQRQPVDVRTACNNSKLITNVSVTSGSGTGSAPTKVKIQQLREHLGNHPLAIASGVSVDNIKSYIGLAQYAMVATSITDNKELIIEQKLTELINQTK